nr:U5 small nuclear ribonucleoprotein 40kDa subunit [Cryptomonas sp.]
MYFRINFTTNNILNCSFSEDGQYLGCGDDSGVISLWQSENISQNYNSFKLHNSSINRVLFSSDLLYTAASDGNCKIVDFKNCKEIRTLKNSGSIHVNDIDCYNQTIITANNNGTVKLWDKRLKLPIESISHGIHLKISKFINMHYMFMTAGILSEIFIWDLRRIEKRRLETRRVSQKNLHIASMTVSKDRQSFLSSDSAGNFFQLFMNNPIRPAKFFDIEVKLLSKCKFSKNVIKTTSDRRGKFFLYGNENGFVLILSKKNAKIIHNIKEHTGKVNDINFHPNAEIFCSCGSDNSLVFRTIRKDQLFYEN